MKKILIPTDFSLSAKNAAYYGMHLAKEMKADIKLCNAVTFPVEFPSPTYVSVPSTTVDMLEQEAVEKLKHTAEKMIEIAQLDAEGIIYHPSIEYETKIGPVTEMVVNLARERSVSLVVMGMSGSGGLGQFLLGSNSRAMIEAATFPVLFVPANARFRKLSKIAFATDLSEQDVAVIHVLAGFARILNAEILIVHISDQTPENMAGKDKKNKEFLNEITNKVNYHKIYYQHVLSDTVDAGLSWLAGYGQIEMLAMVHRKHNVLHRLFKGSHTQRLRKKIEIPLLVFPPDCSNKVL